MTTNIDFAVYPWEFSDTETSVTAVSDRAKALMAEKFGFGAVSFMIGVGSLEQWAEQMQNQMYTVEVTTV